MGIKTRFYLKLDKLFQLAAQASTSTSTPRKSPRKVPGSSGAGEGKKPHHFKPGTQALREIRRLQKSVNLLIPAGPFIRSVREISSYIALKSLAGKLKLYKPFKRYKKKKKRENSINHIYFQAAEDYLVQLFENSMLCSIHAKRVTLSKRLDSKESADKFCVIYGNPSYIRIRS